MRPMRIHIFTENIQKSLVCYLVTNTMLYKIFNIELNRVVVVEQKQFINVIPIKIFLLLLKHCLILRIALRIKRI